MSVPQFADLLRHPAPGFQCYQAGETGREFVARIRHHTNPPASAESLSKIIELLGPGVDALLEFYERYDGAILYTDVLSDAAGIELYPAREWSENTDEMREWYQYESYDEEDDPYCLVSGVAIGEVPHSRNYFVWPIRGPEVGKIFYLNHEDWPEEPFAGDFHEFLLKISSDPASLLAKTLGCYTRYSDGQTDIQWIPREYLEDVNRLGT